MQSRCVGGAGGKNRRRGDGPEAEGETGRSDRIQAERAPDTSGRLAITSHSRKEGQRTQALGAGTRVESGALDEGVLGERGNRALDGSHELSERLTLRPRANGG